MVGDRDVHDPPPLVGEDHEHEQEAAGGGRYHEEVRGGELLRVFVRNVRHVWEGGLSRRIMYFATDAWQTLRPSFNNSP